MIPSVEKQRILLVDDDRFMRMYLRRGLRNLEDKYDIETVSGGPEALSRLAETTFELLVTDYEMPGMNGLELAQQVREQAFDTRIVLMSAHKERDFRSLVGKVEYDGYIEKPSEIIHLSSLIEQFMDF